MLMRQQRNRFYMNVILDGGWGAFCLDFKNCVLDCKPEGKKEEKCKLKMCCRKKRMMH